MASATEVLYHRTVERFPPTIMAEGRRHHFRPSKDVVQARKGGARRGEPVVLAVDSWRMHRDGHRLSLSASGVWPTGAVTPGYLPRA